MIPLDLKLLIKFGSIIIGILFFLSLLISNWIKKKKNNYIDLMVVGIAGSSVPTGCGLIYCSFVPQEIINLSDAGIHIAFAGLGLLYIAITTFREKM